jgi:hypothetical protein
MRQCTFEMEVPAAAAAPGALHLANAEASSVLHA